jgi:hypothetical protein
MPSLFLKRSERRYYRRIVQVTTGVSDMLNFVEADILLRNIRNSDKRFLM